MKPGKPEGGFMPKTSEMIVNRADRSVEAEPERSLLSVLRDELGLTGSKYGCGEGQCGACTVLLDGTAVRSCVTPLRAALGREITTIEGLETNGRLHPLQQAFIDRDALQCGYCTSGMIVSGVALLRKNANPSTADIVRAMQGNVCRCGTYPRIVLAVQMAAKRLREEGK
jgi:aerobic-type carbon monoxide dehydrogenase small subunit (CoxS/CutS family)